MDFDNVKPTNKPAQGYAGYAGFGSRAAAQPVPETEIETVDAVSDATAEEAVQAGVEDGVKPQSDFGLNDTDADPVNDEYKSDSEIAAELGVASGFEDESDAIADEPDVDDEDDDLPETDMEAAEPRGQDAVDSYRYEPSDTHLRLRALELALDLAIKEGFGASADKVVGVAEEFFSFVIGETD